MRRHVENCWTCGPGSDRGASTWALGGRYNRAMRTTAAAIVAFLVCGACGSSKPPEGPKPDDRIKALEAELTKTKDDLAKANAAADELRKTEAELKAKADEANALQAKLAEAVGQNGEVTTA